MKYDGTIIIGTEVNTDGMDQGLDDINTKVEKAGTGFKKLGSIIKSISLTFLTIALTALVSLFGSAVEKSTEAQARIEHIKTILGNIVEELGQLILPIVEKILEIIDYAVSGLGMIIEYLFNVDITTKRTSDSAEDLNKGLKGSVKSAKALKKQLLGFDEMNVLNDSGGTSALGGLGTSIKEVKDMGKTIKDALGLDGTIIDKETLEKELQGLPDWVQEKIRQEWGKEQLQKKFRENGFTQTFVELMFNKKEENEKKIRDITPMLNDFLNGSSKNRQKVVDEFKKSPWITAMFGTDTDINNKTNKVKGATDDVTNKSKTNATNTKNSWTTAINDIITKLTGKNGLTDKVMAAFGLIPTDATTEAVKAVNNIGNVIKNFKPPNVAITVGVSQDSMNNALKKIKNFFNGNKLSVNILLAGTSATSGHAKGAIINPPRLAVGGIINRPGRGVPLASGGAIGGERGPEAIIPLTDSVQMERLGQSIARNIVVNLTNEVKLDGKQLSRYISQVMQDTQFSSNGGVM